MNLRCSALPRAFKCAASVHDDGLRVDPVNEAASAGTAAHAALATLVETGAVEWDALPDLAKRHGCDLDELRMLVALGRKLWEQVGGWFVEPLAEVPLIRDFGAFTLSGHADVISYDTARQHVVVADWKSGRVDSDYTEQLRGYAVLGLVTYGALTADAVVLWIREQDVERLTMDSEGFDEWFKRVHSTIVAWDGTYRPGDHCTHCPRLLTCPAATAMARRDVSILAEQEGVDFAALEPARRTELYELAGRVAKLAENVRALAKAHLEAGGEVPGYRIRTDEPREIDIAAAWSVLDAHGLTTAENIGAVAKVSISKAEDVVRKAAGRGHGAKAVEEFRSQLEAAGALSRGSRNVMERRRS